MVEASTPDSLAPSFWDGVHRIAKGAVSAFPVVGGPATELFATLVAAPLDKRRDEWLSYCYRGLKRLEEEFEGFNVEGVFRNEAFVTAFVKATRVAVADHREGKREALRNAVLNCASPRPPDEDMQQLFIDLIDVLTPSHLIIMNRVNLPWGWSGAWEKQPHGLPSPYFAPPFPDLDTVFPQLDPKVEVFDFLLRDLAGRGLLAIVVTKSNKEKWECHMGPTPMGMQFRKFITCPIDE
ncbi:MAG: hypothetical protein HY914_14455 [Desulfomonile tiedjei]|nr:hypothetical protein [Desulfomonile tiedjei]